MSRNIDSLCIFNNQVQSHINYFYLISLCFVPTLIDLLIYEIQAIMWYPLTSNHFTRPSIKPEYFSQIKSYLPRTTLCICPALNPKSLNDSLIWCLKVIPLKVLFLHFGWQYICWSVDSQVKMEIILQHIFVIFFKYISTLAFWVDLMDIWQ